MTAYRELRHTAKLALALIGGCSAVFEARAAFDCTSPPAGLGITAITSISANYDPSFPIANVSTGSFTVTCIRLLSDPNTVTYFLGAGNGTHFGGGTRRVHHTTNPPPPNSNRYNYGLFRDAGLAQAWGDTSDAGDRIAVTITFAAGATTGSGSGVFYMRLQQDLTPGQAGTYTDTVTVTLNNPPGANPTNTFGVSVITPNSCLISTAPGNVNFAYTSFQLAAAAASSSFGLICTTALPYTMALDATSGTLLGLNYTLAMSASPCNPSVPVTGGTGTGATQNYCVNGSIAGGQSGTCAVASCVGSQTRTLTISY